MFHSDPNRSEPVVEIKGLHHRYGASPALLDINLTVPRGAFLAILGGPGAGKTTLVKHLLGLRRAQSGTVRVFGNDPALHPELVLPYVGYVPEENDLPSENTIRELLRYGQQVYPDWQVERAEELRREFRLKSDARIGNLSHDQRAEVALLIALACQPSIVILDNAGSHIDQTMRCQLREIIADFFDDRSITTIMTFGSLVQMGREEFSTVILEGGELRFTGSANDAFIFCKAHNLRL